MSYSRWIWSNWYIFWDSRRSGGTKDDQMLAVWYVDDWDLPIFSYRDLKDIDVDGLKDLLELKISDEEYEECLEGVRKWLKEVDKEFGGGK